MVGHKARRMLPKRVRSRQSTKTVRKPSQSVSDTGEVDTTYTTVERDVALFSPSHSIVETDFGEAERGSLVGMMLPGTDIDTDYRLNHGGNEYEVETVTGIPDDDNAIVEQIFLTQVDN